MTMELKSSSPLASQTVKKVSPPGPLGLPILGNMPFLGKYPYQTFTKLAKQYGDVFKLHLGARPVVVINGLETIKQAMLKQKTDFADRPDFVLFQTGANGLSMGAADYGPALKKQREVAFKAMHDFFISKKSLIEQQVAEEGNELADIFLSYDSQAFDPQVDISVAVANSTSKLLFSDKNDRNDENFLTFIKNVRFLVKGPIHLLSDFLPQPRFLAQMVDRPKLAKIQHIFGLFEEIVNKKIEAHQKSFDPNQLRDITDSLLKTASELNESEKKAFDLEKRIVMAIPQELMGTGIEPHCSIVYWALLYMIIYPDIQAELQKELDQVIGKDQPICFEDHKKLPFTQACIQEIMRHSPPFPLALPHAASRDTTLNGYFIPKKQTVFLNLYGLTRDERYWEEPEKFNPHRFLNSQGQIRDDLLDKYYPFGLGKRRCFGEYIGRLEVFMMLTSLIRKCKFEKVDGENYTFDPDPGVSIAPQPYKLIVKPRF